MPKPPCPLILCILDGWGYRAESDNNAIALAKTPIFDKCWASFPHTLLSASGESVGLPEGQMGNSEVGHMNIGAGRVVYQDLPLINRAFAKNEVEKNPAILDFIDRLKQSNGTCHLMGLLSTGGVHAHQDHILALARIVAANGVPVAIHAILDGRDTPPQSGADYIGKFQTALREVKGAKLASLCGRYYAMDRDKRWDRIAKAYDLYVSAEAARADKHDDPVKLIKSAYAESVTDEFFLPIALNGYTGMKDGDGILFANFRTDRAREILEALLAPDFTGFERKKIVKFAAALGMVVYSDLLGSLMTTLFPPKKMVNSLGEVLSKANLKQLRLAETEKFPHVTFFFNGGREEPFKGEDRILVPSAKVATYDLQPEMSAIEITDKAVPAIESGSHDFILINYANPDMVGHTGILDAAIKAVETVDTCAGRLLEATTKAGGLLILTADHGNCEIMQDPATGAPHTAHTTAQVPFILTNAKASLRTGALANIAPTILSLLGLPKPEEMEKTSLLSTEAP